MRKDFASRILLVAVLAASGCTIETHSPTPPPATYRIETTKLGDVPLRLGTVLNSEDGLHAALKVVAGDPQKLMAERQRAIRGDESWQLSVDGRRGPAFIDIDMLSARFSPDGRRCAYFAKPDDASVVAVIDHQLQPQSGKYSGNICFSPDSQHVAFTVSDGDRESLIVDGKVLHRDTRIENLTFSPDGKRLAFVVYRQGGQRFILDGQEGPEFQMVRSALFSPDGKRFAHIASEFRDGKHIFFVLANGQKSGPYSAVGDLEFSSDSRRFGFFAQRAGQWMQVVEGQERSVENEILWHSPLGSTDQRLTFIRAKGSQNALVIGGHEDVPFERVQETTLQVSRDGRHSAYIAETGGNLFVVHDGSPSPAFAEKELSLYSLALSPDGTRVAYVVNRGLGTVAVVGGIEHSITNARRLLFSPDSKHLAYIATGKTDWRLVIDGQPVLAPLNSTFRLASTDPLFSPDAQHVACVATHQVLLDQAAGPYCGEIISPGPIFRPDGTLEYLMINEDVLYRVKHIPAKK